MQRRQPQYDYLMDNDDTARVSQKMKSSEVDLRSHIPKPEFFPCAVDRKEARGKKEFSTYIANIDMKTNHKIATFVSKKEKEKTI